MIPEKWRRINAAVALGQDRAASAATATAASRKPATIHFTGTVTVTGVINLWSMVRRRRSGRTTRQ
jgi:hypothetical protein